MKRRKRRATIISTGLRKKNHRGAFRNNQKLIILTFLFICGLFLGVLTFRNIQTDSTGTLKDIIENYCRISSTQSIMTNILSKLGTESLYLLIALVFGLCVAGEPVLWIIPLVKGLGIGLISGYLYGTFTLNGMLYFSAILLIPSVVSSAGILMCCKESILMTRDLNRIIIKQENAAKGGEMLKLYFLRYAVIFSSLVFAAILSAVLTYLFAAKINLF